jgi:hypothetical protein
MGLVKGLVIGRINIMGSCRETCVHDMQILIREGEIENNIRPEFAHEGCKFRYIVGVNPSRLDVSSVSGLNVIFDGLALGEGPAGNHNLPKNIRDLRAFMGCHGGHSSCPDYHYPSMALFFTHRYFLCRKLDLSQ